jgi:hypothetical protein
MILAGTSPKACEHCGAPWERVVDRKIVGYSVSPRSNGNKDRNDSQDGRTERTVKTIGWQPTCNCPNNVGSAKCLILDPFSGSGTTLKVAMKHNRSAIGLELNPLYIKLSEERTSLAQTTFFDETPQ